MNIKTEVTKNENWYSTASKSEQKKFREWVSGVLRNETATLTFRKKDGTIRVMKASLREEHIPVYEKKTEAVRKPNDEVISVVDLEKNEWRSVRFDSIQGVEFTIGK